MSNVIDRLIRRQYDENLKKIASLEEANKKIKEKLEIAIDVLINVEQAIEEIVHEDGQTLNWDEVKTTLEDYVHESIKKIRS